MSRMAMLLVVGVLVVLAPRLGAQEVAVGAPCSYEICAVRHTAGFFGERLVRGEASQEILKINFSGSNAADFLSRVDAAARPARDFRTRRVRSVVLGMIAGAVSAYFVTNMLAEVYDSTLESDISTSEAIGLTGGIALGIFSGVEAMRARNSLSQAIWEFNRAPVR